MISMAAAISCYLEVVYFAQHAQCGWICRMCMEQKAKNGLCTGAFSTWLARSSSITAEVRSGDWHTIHSARRLLHKPGANVHLRLEYCSIFVAMMPGFSSLE